MKIIDSIRGNVIMAMMLQCSVIPVISYASDITPNGIRRVVGDETIGICFMTPKTVRITKSPLASKIDDKESLSVIATPMDLDIKVSQKGNNTVVSSEELSVWLNEKGEVTFVKDGMKLLSEGAKGSFQKMDDAGVDSFTVSQYFNLGKEEAIYGLGNLENGKLSQRGVTRKLLPGNIEDGIPMMVSVNGYGLFWDNYSPTTFSDKDGITSFESEVGDMIDYYFMSGDNIPGVIAEMRGLTGDVPMFPLWTYGFWQSRERYKSQYETVGVVKKYREAGVPLDGIIQDWQYWGNNYLWNAMEFMNPEFPDPKGMIDEIHAMNAHTIISIWSSFGPQTKPFAELKEKGLLFDISTWPQSGIAEQWPPRMDYPSGVKVYDAYSKEARDIYWRNLTRMHDLGFDGWWMDSTEPDHFDIKDSDYDTPTGMGSFRRVRNAYPLMTVGGVYDNQKGVDKEKRVFILTRSGYAGQQRYGCNVWTGDVTSSWQNLRNQIPALLNFTLTGNPNSNSDLGGFFSGAYNDKGPNSAARNPLFQELYVRWVQFGAFTPMMRSHGADIKREIYHFGEKGEVIYDAIAEAIKLRYSLLPYIYSTSWDVTSGRGSFMMPLSAYYPEDKRTWDCQDQYMFGGSFMVAPIVNAKYTPEHITTTDENTGWDRQEKFESLSNSNVDFMKPFKKAVYLPKGEDWWDYNTSKKYKGGSVIHIDADIKTVPVFVKAGSIIPIGPDVQYATEKPWDDLEIKVYGGKDGEFVLYEDEFDNYNYERGEYSTIRFAWDDKNSTLTVGDRNGQFKGMLKSRVFRVVRIEAGAEPREVKVEYDGSQTKVKV